MPPSSSSGDKELKNILLCYVYAACFTFLLAWVMYALFTVMGEQVDLGRLFTYASLAGVIFGPFSVVAAAMFRRRAVPPGGG